MQLNTKPARSISTLLLRSSEAAINDLVRSSLSLGVSLSAISFRLSDLQRCLPFLCISQMLTCIACSKQLGAATAASRDVAGGVESPIHDPDDEDGADGGATPSTRQAIKALTSQVTDSPV